MKQIPFFMLGMQLKETEYVEEHVIVKGMDMCVWSPFCGLY
jgi:hypothetical protein